MKLPIALLLASLAWLYTQEATNHPAPDPPLAEDSSAILATLAGKADLIVFGSITDFVDGSARDGPISYECTIAEVLAGAPPSSNTLWFNSRGGGRLGRRGAKYWAGERVLLFLEARGVGDPQAGAVEYHVLKPFVYYEEREGLVIDPRSTQVREVITREWAGR